MRKKPKEIILLAAGFGLILAFLQTIYSYFYYSIPPAVNPGALYLQVETFMEPNNLSIFLGILFFVGFMLVVLFVRD